MQFPIRELKSSLSRVIAIARSGETVEITSHRKPVARIIGIAPVSATGLALLIAKGAVSWNGSKPTPMPPVALSASLPPVSQMVLEDRH